MTTVTVLLLVVEIFFTILKSILLEFDKPILTAAAYISYIFESIAGFALTIILARRAWIASGLGLVKAGVIIIILSELVSVLTELSIIRRRQRDINDTAGQKRRRVLLCFAPVVSFVAIPMPYWFQLLNLENTIHEEPLTFRSHLTVGIAVILFVALIWVQCLPRHYYTLKILISSLVMLIVFIASAVVLTVTTEAHSIELFEFTPLSAGVAAILLAVASLLTAVSAISVTLTDDSDDVGPEIQAVFAVAALSGVGPGVIISQAGPGREMFQVFLTVTPQIGAVVFPMLFVVVKRAFYGEKPGNAPTANTPTANTPTANTPTANTPPGIYTPSLYYTQYGTPAPTYPSP